MNTKIDTYMPDVVADDLTRLTPQQLAYLAAQLVKNYPQVADKLETALANAFFDSNMTTISD